MEYNDEATSSLEIYEQMAKEYHFSLKEQGYVFINLNDEGKMFLIEDVFEILGKLKASYKYLHTFFDSHLLYQLTTEHIDQIKNYFNVKEKENYYIANLNKTKCFINSIALENELVFKLLFLAQKCEYGKEIMQIILQRTKFISKNLQIPFVLNSKRY